jgi:dTDP-glucose 4,6-dehydratase
MRKGSSSTYAKIILITGGAGFIGSNYLNICVKKYPKYLFVNIDCLTYAANLKNILVNKSANYQFEKADICNKKTLESIFRKYHPTDIIHFAAESHVDLSIKNPHRFVETNIVGTHNLLTLSKQYGLNRFYQISTDEVYGALGATDPAFTEHTALAPNSPYSASKASADMLVRAYHETFGLNTVISRCSNNYGPRQDRTKLIPKSIYNLLSNKKIPLYGKGQNIRDWLYVDDHVEAIDTIFHKGISGEIYNVGGEREILNYDLVVVLIKKLKKSLTSIEYVPDRLGHDFRYAINCEKLQMLGWTPKVSFEKGIEKTISFYRENQ